MEINRRNLLTEDEITQVIRSHPEDGWDLLQEGRIEPVSLRVLPETGENQASGNTIRQIGGVAAEGAEIRRQKAA